MTEEKGNTIQEVFVGEEIRDVFETMDKSVGELMYTRFPNHSSSKATLKITIEFYPCGEVEDE